MNKAEVYARVVKYFKDPQTAQKWLDRPIPSLGSRRPADLCQSEEGLKLLQAYLDKTMDVDTLAQ